MSQILIMKSVINDLLYIHTIKQINWMFSREILIVITWHLDDTFRPNMSMVLHVIARHYCCYCFYVIDLILYCFFSKISIETDILRITVSLILRNDNNGGISFIWLHFAVTGFRWFFLLLQNRNNSTEHEKSVDYDETSIWMCKIPFFV